MSTVVRRPRRNRGRAAGFAAAAAMLAASWLAGPAAHADGTVRLALQKTGTVAWEIDVIRTHGLDARHGVRLDVVELASPEAGKIALRGGSADLIVSDWLWVSRERGLGTGLVFYPYSSTVGAVMVPPDSAIDSPAGLKDRKLGVAGGALDKSWLLLQAAMLEDGIDLKKEADVVFGAPPLLAEKALQGELDANLNYWNFCARLEAKGFRRLVGIDELLPGFGARGRVAMLGYVFDGKWAEDNRPAIDGFLAASREAKQILATSDAEWERIAPLIGTDDPQVLAVYRDRFREGIPDRPIAEEEADAAVIYGVLARVGGRELVGEETALNPGTFYRPAGQN